MTPRPEHVGDPATVAARRILDHLAAIYQPTHEYVPADPSAFRHLDLGWYDRTAAAFEARGFRRFGDIEDKTITNAPNTVLRPTFLRTLVSREGTATAALYDPRLRGIGLRLVLWLLRTLPRQVVDFETECSDGSFIGTSNGMAASKIKLPPSIDVAWLPMKTEPLAVYAAHTARVQAHLAAHPSVTPVVIDSPEAMMQSQHRQNALKAAFRGEIPGLTTDELKSLSWFGDAHLGAVLSELEAEHQRRSA